MKKLFKIIIVLLIISFGSSSFASSVRLYNEMVDIPNNLSLSNLEVRGAWIYTVWGSFPSKKGLSEEEYRKEYIKVLDDLEKYKINTVIFQVRPSGDAFYDSSINPISEFLTGKQGEGFSFDPLPWMIDETHRRGMSFHAWLNPYRLTYRDYEGTKEEILSQLSPMNFAFKNPDTVFQVGKKIYLKPWDERVINHLKETVEEILRKYPIDAIHFDDYFYPPADLSNSGGFYEDEKVFFEASGYNDIGDFRRAQTDKLILGISQTIKGYNRGANKNVEFGISPVGIWRNNKMDPQGSEVTSNYTSYDKLFADTKKWVENRWMDYVVPQIYWTFDNKGASYSNSTDWWAKITKDSGVKLYIGQALYKLADGDWKDANEIYNQLAFNSRYENIKGTFFFHSKSFSENTSEQNKAFLERYGSELDRLMDKKPLLHQNNFQYKKYSLSQGTLLHWIDSENSKFEIYRDDELLTTVSGNSNSYFYLDPKVNNKNYRIVIINE